MAIKWMVPIAALIGLLVAFALASWVGKAPEGTDRMKEISGYIREGALAFLKREYRTMAVVIVALFVLVGLAINWTSAVLYVCGALLSVLAGFFGMNVPLPFTEEPNAWIYILMTSLILWVALSQWLKKITRK